MNQPVIYCYEANAKHFTEYQILRCCQHREHTDNSYDFYKASTTTDQCFQFEPIYQNELPDLPFYPPKDIDSEIHDIMVNRFKLKQLQKHQEAIIKACLMGKDCFGIIATGGGKSLCYQPTALLSPGVTVVISPLKSLIVDQVNRLNDLKISAAYIFASQNQREQLNILQKIRENVSDVKLIYTTPEQISQNANLITMLQHLHGSQSIAKLVVDEVHCLSQWGLDFRPAYLKLNRLKSQFPNVPIMALTATATSHVRQDVINNLQLDNPSLFVNTCNRPNIRYSVLPKKSRSVNVSEIAEIILRRFANLSVIIYCYSQQECETKGVIVTNVKNHLTSKHKKEAQELVSAEEKRKESDNSKCKSLKRKTDKEGSIDKFLSAKKSLGKAYSKSSEKYRNLKHKLTVIAACTTVSQNAFQSLEFKRYIEECDPNAAACIPSRPILTSWVIDFSTLACHSLEQPHTGKAIKYALHDCLEKYGFRDSSNVFRYVTDKGANVICALKPYKVLMAVPSQYLSDFDDEFPVDFVMEESEELDGDESEQITEIFDLDSEASEEEESQIEDDNEDNMDWMEEEFPKQLTCIDHELNTMCHREGYKMCCCREAEIPSWEEIIEGGANKVELVFLCMQSLVKTKRSCHQSLP
ncbi:Bloom Syndrome-like protein [Daphnia magna]|uniref:Bloom Syndrome-like protein n=1 Tax=Daphnia magna TaxID=35525 RepID=A0A164N3N2_9CRUS|nr:Bloom Syndrome-like protein [Daphnia magna]